MNLNTDMLNQLRNLNKDDILSALGLEQQRSTTESVAPGLGFFVAGLIAGLGAGLLLAPRSGEETRNMLRDHADQAQDAVREKASQAEGSVREKADQARQHAKDAANKVSDKVAGN